MAQFEDYLLRQFAGFAEAIRRVIRARDEEQDVEEAIADGLRSLVGLSAETLTHMAPDAVRPLFVVDERVEVDKALAVAWLLDAAADQRTAPNESHALRVAAVGLHALAAEAAPLSDERAQRLDERVRRVHLATLPISTLGRLLAHYEAHDQFDRAEDVAFAWVRLDADSGARAGRGLYERLWSLPDARLKAGGLSSQEVLEGLAELERLASG